MYEYNIKVRRVVDGDTVDVDIDLGFGVWLYNERIRLSGIDAYESRTRDLEEKAKGLAAKEYVENFCETEMVLKCTGFKGKFGRILGELWRTTSFADKSLNEYLVEKGHANVYHGGKR